MLRDDPHSVTYVILHSTQSSFEKCIARKLEKRHTDNTASLKIWFNNNFDSRIIYTPDVILRTSLISNVFV